MRTSPERLDWVMVMMNVHYKIAHTEKALLARLVDTHTNQAQGSFQPLISTFSYLSNTNKKGGQSLLKIINRICQLDTNCLSFYDVAQLASFDLDIIESTAHTATNATLATANERPTDAVIPRVIKPTQEIAATDNA